MSFDMSSADEVFCDLCHQSYSKCDCWDRIGREHIERFVEEHDPAKCYTCIEEFEAELEEQESIEGDEEDMEEEDLARQSEGSPV